MVRLTLFRCFSYVIFCHFLSKISFAGTIEVAMFFLLLFEGNCNMLFKRELSKISDASSSDASLGRHDCSGNQIKTIEPYKPNDFLSKLNTLALVQFLIHLQYVRLKIQVSGLKYFIRLLWRQRISTQGEAVNNK